MTDAPLTLSFVPFGPDFAMASDARMPVITVTAKLAKPPSGAVRYTWTVKFKSASHACAHALGKVTSHPDIVKTTDTNSFTIPFTAMRGGDLSVAVAVTVEGHELTAERHDLQVTGTNPTVADLRAALPTATDAFKKLMRLESALRQFRSAVCPLWSADNLGGVGICQLTSPDNDDQIWDWKANATGGLAFYHTKQSSARAYPGVVRRGPTFAAQVKAYNAKRAAAAKAAAGKAPATGPAAAVVPVIVRVPEYTPEQLELDTIRAYNGYAGGLHEYRLRTDADGILVVTLDAIGSGGVAEWERISAADRTAHYDVVKIPAGHRGDPNYVDDVLAQATF